MATKCNPLNHFNFSVNKFSTPRAHRSTHQLPFFFLATKSKQALISSRAADRCCQMLVGYSTIIRIRSFAMICIFFLSFFTLFCLVIHIFLQRSIFLFRSGSSSSPFSLERQVLVNPSSWNKMSAILLLDQFR